jgi:predicted RND superfamily exporter protein
LPILAGLFVGFRRPVTQVYPDVPLGVRVDAHFGFDNLRDVDVIISAQLDLAPLAALIAGVVVDVSTN